MSRVATYASEEGLARDPHSPKPEEILAQLSQILASPSFHGSKRCHQFLEYVCEKSLAGDAGALKERTIAIEVFGRAPQTAGQSEDTIVRVGAREVRKRLAQYYVTAEGGAAPVLIELPPGSYAPEIRYAAAAKEAASAPVPVPAVEAPSVEMQPAVERRKSRWLLVAGVGILAVCLMLVAGITRFTASHSKTAAFSNFWAPVFQSSKPLLVGVGHPIVYQPSRRASLLSEQRLPPTQYPMVRALDLPPSMLDGSDIVPVLNQFIGFGDMVAANEVTQMMARRGLNVSVLLASSIPFADLRNAQAYLIGSLSNHWTMELGQNWRFQFGWTPQHVPVIVDTQSSQRREWAVPAHDDGSTPEDYSLICRIRNSPTGGLLIVSAGIKQFGTEAAGRLLADPVQLSDILNKLPQGWEDKNVQIVLHMKVLGNTPAQPEVVASHVW